MSNTLPFGNCTTSNTNQIISVEEKSKKFIISNTGGKIVSTIKVDKCLITDNTTLRCDYVFEVSETKVKPASHAIYVELKGRDIKHAIDQLRNSLLLLHKRHQSIVRKDCYVVCSSVPRFNSAIGNIKVEFKKKFNASLSIRENLHRLTV